MTAGADRRGRWGASGRRSSAVPRGGPGRHLAGFLFAAGLAAGLAATAAVAPVVGGAPAPAASAQAAVPGLSVTVALPANPLTVGERAEAVITLRVPAARLAAEPRFPAWRDAWGEAEVREHGEVRRHAGAAPAAAGTTTPGVAPAGNGGTDSTVAGAAGTGATAAGATAARTGSAGALAVYSQRLVLTAFRPGKVELPRMTIAVPLAAGTVQALTPAGLALQVRSVLPAGAKEVQPRPAAALRPLPLGWAFFAVLGGLLLLVAAAVWALRRRARRAGVEGTAATPSLPPLAELLASLERLAGRGSALAVHTGISQALRRYLGRTAGFPAPESTTSEIQRRLLGQGWPAPLVRRMVEVLRACDMVKFARQDAGEERAAERLGLARRLGEDFAAQAAVRHAAAEEAAARDAARAKLEAAG